MSLVRLPALPAGAPEFVMGPVRVRSGRHLAMGPAGLAVPGRDVDL